MYWALVIFVGLVLVIGWLFIRQTRRDNLVRHAILAVLNEAAPQAVTLRQLRNTVERRLNRSVPNTLFQADLAQLLDEGLIRSSYEASVVRGGEPKVSYRLAAPRTSQASG